MDHGVRRAQSLIRSCTVMPHPLCPLSRSRLLSSPPSSPVIVCLSKGERENERGKRKRGKEEDGEREEGGGARERERAREESERNRERAGIACIYQWERRGLCATLETDAHPSSLSDTRGRLSTSPRILLLLSQLCARTDARPTASGMSADAGFVPGGGPSTTTLTCTTTTTSRSRSCTPVCAYAPAAPCPVL